MSSVASSSAVMGAVGVGLTTQMLAETMVKLNILIHFLDETLVVLLVASMAAGNEISTYSGATVLRGSDVNMAVNSNFVTAAGYRPLNRLTTLTDQLILPARKIKWNMIASHWVLLVNFHHASLGAGISTWRGAWMVAPDLWFEARLETGHGTMKPWCMA